MVFQDLGKISHNLEIASQTLEDLGTGIDWLDKRLIEELEDFRKEGIKWEQTHRVFKARHVCRQAHAAIKTAAQGLLGAALELGEPGLAKDALGLDGSQLARSLAFGEKIIFKTIYSASNLIESNSADMPMSRKLRL